MHPSFVARRSILLAGAVGLLDPWRTALASAQTGGGAPAAPVRFIVPLGPGSSLETLTRQMGAGLQALTGTSTFVEHRPGADMIIAVQEMLRAPADGTTILALTPTPVVFNTLLRSDLPYDPISGIRPLVMTSQSPWVLVTGASSDLGSVSDVISTARARPGAVKLGADALTARFVGRAIELRSGVTFTHVPYRTWNQVASDIAGGTIDIGLFVEATARPLIASGRLRPLAVSGARRHPLLPEVPTLAQAGITGAEHYTWDGFAIHGRTPEPIAQALEDRFLGLARSNAITAFLVESGKEPSPLPGKAFGTFIAADRDRYRRLIDALPRDAS